MSRCIPLNPSLVELNFQGGVGPEATLQRIDQTYDGSRPFVWADNTGGAGFITAANIMDHVTVNFTEKQRANFRKLNSTDDVRDTCILNFSGASSCFAAITFEAIPTDAVTDARGINYTIHTDTQFFNVDVKRHDNEFDARILPLQWGIDRVSRPYSSLR